MFVPTPRLRRNKISFLKSVYLEESREIQQHWQWRLMRTISKCCCNLPRVWLWFVHARLVERDERAKDWKVEALNIEIIRSACILCIKPTNKTYKFLIMEIKEKTTAVSSYILTSTDACNYQNFPGTTRRWIRAEIREH